jgi:dTMP kinase
MIPSGNGLFISLEGGEGAGKSSLAKALAGQFERAGRDVVLTREPGGSPGAERIRALLLDAAAGFGATTEALLFAAARRDHVEKVIRPALAAGSVVISDRFADSTRAYQGAAGKVPLAIIDRLQEIATGGLMPDLTILVDVPPETGLGRARARRGEGVTDRFERQDLGFHARVRDGFLAMARAEPGRFVVIDGTPGESEVQAAMLAALVARGLSMPQETAK